MSNQKNPPDSLLSILPNLLWVVLAAVALAVFYQPLSALLTRSTKLKIGSLEVEAHDQLEKAAKRFPEALRQGSSDRQMLRLRTQWIDLSARDRPYRILVAHDVFEEAQPIQRAFVDLGFDADIALCPEDITKALTQHLYDAVVSDIDWSNCPKNTVNYNGVTFLDYATEKGFAQHTVFFVRNFDPKLGVPKNSYGISNNWYDVLESVFTVLKSHSSSGS